MSSARAVDDPSDLRRACTIAAEVLARLCDAVKAGVTTYDLDQLGRKLIEERGAESACYNYRSGRRVFPAYTCLSVNEEVVHGIGSLNRTLVDGDVIAVDVCVRYNGWIGDNARTVAVGTPPEPVLRLLEVTQQALVAGINHARAGNHVGKISNAIQRMVEGAGMSVVREFVGHGVGRTMHEDPQIPNYGDRRSGPKLRRGMALAIEPMVNLGGCEIRILEDGWTAVALDGKPSAHFEHTVLVTDDEPEILTLAPDKEIY